MKAPGEGLLLHLDAREQAREALAVWGTSVRHESSGAA
jgi:hypothetical protein